MSDKMTTIDFTVSADDLDEAVQFAVETLQSVVEDQKCRGFVVPQLTQESIELVDGEWKRLFAFHSELLPAVK